jgi:hypothetical protein
MPVAEQQLQSSGLQLVPADEKDSVIAWLRFRWTAIRGQLRNAKKVDAASGTLAC